MIPEYPWFERTFPMGLPEWQFPNVVERLRGTPLRLEALAAGIAPQILTRRRAGEWSIQENVGHLWDLEALWLGRLEDFLAGEPVLRAADLTNRRTEEADHNSAALADLLRGFRQARETLVARLDGLAAADVQRTSRHPRLQQPMNVTDYAFFVAEHDDHHLAQITRLRRSFQAG